MTEDQPTPVRFIAEGRDPSATFDADHTGHGNEGDDRRAARRRGSDHVQERLAPVWTQQHGDNTTYEVSPDS